MGDDGKVKPVNLSTFPEEDFRDTLEALLKEHESFGPKILEVSGQRPLGVLIDVTLHQG